MAVSIFTFEIKGDAKTAQKFIDNLAIFSLLANVADVKSLVIHPATTTHSQCTEEELLDQGIKPNTIRLSIGIEKVDDLIAALDAAFEDSEINRSIRKRNFWLHISVKGIWSFLRIFFAESSQFFSGTFQVGLL